MFSTENVDEYGRTFLIPFKGGLAVDELINRLIEVDKQARARVDEAKNNRAKAVEELDSRKQKLKKENEQSFKAFVENKKTELNETLATAKSEIEQKEQSVISELDRVFAEKCDEWVDSIVATVIGE